MDTTDPDIVFDTQGVCNHCHRYDAMARQRLIPEGERRTALDALVANVKQSGRGKPYDCVIGVSGGVDSTYVAWLVKDLGLRPLAVHLDNGWNSELAVANIEKTLKTLSIDLYTHVIDWEEFRDLQVSFLKASTPDGEIPTDHAIFALLYAQAARLGLRHVFTGVNVASEGVLPKKWGYGYFDWRYITDVHRRFDHVLDILVLLESSALTVRQQRTAIGWRHRVHDLHRSVCADRLTESRKSDRVIRGASLKHAGEANHHSQSHRYHGRTNPDGLAVP